MKPLALRYGRGFVAALALSAMTACSQATPKTDAIFLVRHAEKTTEKNDPGLTEAGKARAEALADRLEDEGITRIYSSDYIRTRDTAAPLAERLGLEIEIYDPRDLPGTAETLKATSGRLLVVGHSNTTPQLTELLGGDGGTPIVEETEYDRLYVVTSGDDEPVKSYLTRYGDKSENAGN
nr:putative phosphohistidine phosphatase [uncultured bacterium]